MDRHAVALWGVSRPLAIAAVIVLIGLPTVFATPEDKRQVIVPVRGHVTVSLVVLQMVAAVVSAWIAWHPVAAACVSVLAAVSVVTELPRWSWLLSRPHHAASAVEYTVDSEAESPQP